MICDSLISPPKECITFIKNTHQIDTRDESEGIWKTILLILVVMTVGFVLALFVYTRLIRKEVNQQLSL
jgi:ABC-type arginine/histidine transport system permease subunit